MIKDVVRTGARRPQLEHSQAGDVRLDLSFSDEPSTGRQPMLVAGGTGHSDSIAVRRLDRGHFVFSEEIWGGGLWESGSIPIPPGRPAELRIHLGPAWAVPARSPLSLWRHSVVVWVNGALAWWRWTPGEVPPGAPVVIGENLIGSSAMERLFPGRLNASERVAAPTWQAGGFVAVSLRLGGRGRGTEPLLLTGRPGQDDLLEMEWLPGGKARLSYCHGRKLWINSPIFSWGQNEIHRLRIAAPALPTLDSKPGAADGPLTIDLDGRTVWRTQAPFYVASSDSVVLGGGGLPTLEQPSVLTAAVVDISQEVK